MSIPYQNFLIKKTQTEIDQEFETKLIRTVYSLKWLYDSSHPDFNNNAKNKLSWARVAHCCQKPYSECTNRWNTLLQTYFSSTSDNWIHREDLKKFEPHLHNNFRIPNQFNPSNKPSQIQRDELLNMLLVNCTKFQAVDTTSVERQNIWSTITFRCNAIQPGAYMGALEWKKYWYDMKQNFGIQRLMLRSKLKAMGTKLDVSKYTDEDMKILKICGVTMNDTMAVIAKALGRNLELGFNSELIIPKCLRCIKQRNELIIDGYCETCRSLPSCDLCHIVCEGNIVRYRTTNWSTLAKSLLPTKLACVDEILLCLECSKQLKKKATSEWKSCRVCESEQPNLEFLYGTNNNLLRKAFATATSFTFNEMDGLPGYICKACKIQIQQFNNFYTKFWRTQCKLKSLQSNHFIGTSSDPNLNKDSQVVYLGVNETTNKEQLMVVPSDISMQSEPIVTVVATTVAASTSMSTSSTTTTSKAETTPVQQNCLPPYKVISAAKPGQPLSKFKRIPLQKGGTGDAGVVTTNANQVGSIRNRVIPTNPPLAIKEIYSLQPSTQKATPNNKPSIKVIPTAALQQAKLHGVFSNETVTVTRKIIDLPPEAPKPPVINSKQSISIVNLANGKSVALPQTNNLKPSNRGFTLTKRLVTTPQSEANPILTKEKESIKIIPKPGPPNTMSPQASASSKPAIFTISDYETIEDAPPVFCIPKKNLPDKNNKAEREAEKQLSNFNPSNPPIIKSEVLEQEEYPNEETDIPIDLVEEPEPLMENIPGMLPILPNETEICTDSGMKIIRLNGSMVAVKPHPFIVGAFIPIDLHAQAELSGDRVPSYIRKVDNGEKSQVASTKTVLKNNPQRSEAIIPMFQRKKPSTVTNSKQIIPMSQTTPELTPIMSPQFPQSISEANILMTTEQVEQFIQAGQKQQQQHQQLEQQQHQQLQQNQQLQHPQHQQQLQLQHQQQYPPQHQQQYPPQHQQQYPPQHQQQYPPQQQHPQQQQQNPQQQQQYPPQQKYPQKQQQNPQQQQQNPQQDQQNPLQQQQYPQQQHMQQQQQHAQQQHPQQQQLHPQQQQLHPQQQQLHPQQQHNQQWPHQQLQGIKKPRKYWGTVDEFNVAPLQTKPLLPPAPAPAPPSFSQSMATIQEPNKITQHPKQQTPSTPWIEERKTPAPTEDPLNVQSSSNVRIKQEVLDNDVDDVSIIKPLTSNDTTAGMFYPDSFELEKLTFGADVSLMINNMIQQHSIIHNNMNGSNFDKFINPAFPISYEKRKPEDQVKEKEKERKSKKEDDTKAEAEDTRKKQENEDKNKMKDDKNKEKDPESTTIKPCVKMKMKRFCIKLKRDREPIFTPRPKRLCTLQVQSKSSTSPSPSPSVGTRKSLRLNQV